MVDHGSPNPLWERSRFLPALHSAHERDGWLSGAAVIDAARVARIPDAEAWEAATSYPEFRFAPPASDGPATCMGLSCVLNGAVATPGAATQSCRFRCYDAPVSGAEAPFPEEHIRLAGPLLAADIPDFGALERARGMPAEAALALIDSASLRGRGGAYFPVARKWRSALAEGRPVALVVNAEEGEPGVFKDRAMLCLRPRRFVEGLAIACQVLAPAALVVFVNGEAAPARASLVATLADCAALFREPPQVMSGGGGYVLGEETTLLNAIEGRKPVPRLRPPYPVESGLFGMPTVINNVESIANLALLFRGSVEGYRERGTPEAPGTRIFSVSGRVARPGAYEFALGTPLSTILAAAGAGPAGPAIAVLAGGPSGGFLDPSRVDPPMLPGLLHQTGAVMGSGGIIVLDQLSQVRPAALAMAAFNAAESCGKCTPCREGAPLMADVLARGDASRALELAEVVGAASLCGLGQMAPGPVRSALHFWPEQFR